MGVKQLLTILTILILIGCKTYQSIPIKYEDKLMITKKYIGQVVYSEVQDKYTLVVCTEKVIELCGQVEVPESVNAYIRTAPCYHNVHPEIAARLEHKYFSWNKKEYKIKTW